MNYLILYDPSIFSTKTADEVHKLLTTLPGSSDWWHYLPNSYIVTTASTSAVLSDHIYKAMPDMRFLIVRIELNDSNGVLKKDAWDWINKHKTLATPLRTILKASANPPTKLSGYLPPLPFLGPSNTKLPPIRTLNDILFKLKK